MCEEGHNSRRSVLLFAAAASASIGWSAPLFAQAASAQSPRSPSAETIPAAQSQNSGGPAIAEIVVTAQRRQESAQDVPITIQAFSREALETRRIDGFEQIATFTPALTAAPSSADANGLRFTLRGIGTNDPQIGVESKVALYVDGIYLGKSTGLAFDSPDLERVEVLKGPQGTLYGRNAVAGAINLISARPKAGELTGRAFAEYGNYDAVRVGAAANLPAGENGAFRVSALYNRRSGWVENEGPGADFGGFERFGGRVAAGVNATPDLRLDVAFDYSQSRNEPVYYHALAGTASPTALFAAAVVPVAGRVSEARTPFNVERGKVENFGATFSTEWRFQADNSVKLLVGYRHADARRFSTLLPTYNAAIGNAIYNADLDRNPANGVFSIRNALLAAPVLLQTIGTTTRPDYLAGVAAYTPSSLYQSPPGGTSTLDDHNQFSADLTFTGKAGTLLDYTVGAYYFYERTGTGTPANRRDDASNIVPLLSSLGTLGNGLGRLGALQDPTLPPAVRDVLLRQAQGFAATLYDTLAGVRFSAANELRLKTDAYALYGQLTWHLGERLRLITGARYSIDRKEGYQQASSPIFADNISLVGTPILPNTARRTFKSFDPTVVVQFDVAPSVMAYASRVESFRSGGFNQIASGRRVPGQTYSTDFIYGNEEITAYEVGLKSDLFDRRLRLNLAGYYYLLDNEQLAISPDPSDSVARSIVNADSKVWGGEVDLTLAIAQGVTLNASYAYTDSDADPVTVGRVTINRGTVLGAPKNSASVSIDFDRDLGDRGGVFGTLGYNYKDGALLTYIPVSFISSQNLVDARLGYRFSSGARISVWAQNLLDDKYIVDRIGLGGLAYDIAQYGTPRTYGVAFAVNF